MHWDIIQNVIGHIIFGLYTLTVISLIIVVITENRNPVKTLSWVLVLTLAPVVGIVIYFFFGQDNRKRKLVSPKIYRRLQHRPKHPPIQEPENLLPPDYHKIAHLLKKHAKSPLLCENKIEIYRHGKEKMETLFQDIKEAKHHIHIEYYRIMNDTLGKKLSELLIQKVSEGVFVRIIYDDVGSLQRSKRYFKRMQRKGIEIYPFLPVAFPFFTSKVNYRNHRKVVVIDGKIGYFGGMNIADRYIKKTKIGFWRDNHFRIVGQGVQGMQASFLIDWLVVSNQLINSPEYYPPLETKGLPSLPMQFIHSNPIGPWRILHVTMNLAINTAKKSIYIQTPYFLPTEEINTSLQTAALGGVDVRLMIPAKSDSHGVNLASHSYLRDLMHTGVKVYFYTEGFLHAKLLIVDDCLCSIGSANMDFRSFEHNFELNAFVYDQNFTERMKNIFLEDCNHCIQPTKEEWAKRPKKVRIVESFFRLFSPLL